MFLRVNFKVGNIPISEERTGGLRFKNRNLTNPLGRLVGSMLGLAYI